MRSTPSLFASPFTCETCASCSARSSSLAAAASDCSARLIAAAADGVVWIAISAAAASSCARRAALRARAAFGAIGVTAAGADRGGRGKNLQGVAERVNLCTRRVSNVSHLSAIAVNPHPEMLPPVGMVYKTDCCRAENDRRRLLFMLGSRASCCVGVSLDQWAYGGG